MRPETDMKKRKKEMKDLHLYREFEGFEIGIAAHYLL